MNELFNKISDFAKHYRILFFLGVFVATILVIRFSVQFYNPNPVFSGMEFHHFDYGVILLLITVLLLLFGNQKYEDLFSFMAAISSALIIDSYFALRLSVVENHATQLEVYNSTIVPVIVSVAALIILLFLINSFRKR